MICIVDCGTDWLKDIQDTVNTLGYSSKIVTPLEMEKCDIDSFSAIIISGASINLTEVDLNEYLKPFRFMNTARIPMLGICLGHQLLGIVHGAKISKGTMINKQEEVELLLDDALFSGMDNPALLREEHCEFITVPNEFVLLAKSNSCANEAMKHRKKKIYGVQFHPEVSGPHGRAIFKNFLRMCSEPLSA